MRAASLALIAVSALGFMAAKADVRLDYTSTGNDAAMTRLEIAGTRLRADTGDTSVIVDTASNEMLSIDRGARTYSRIDAATLENLAGAASAALDQAQALLENLPAEQRQALEDRLGTKIPGAAHKSKVGLVASGRHERVDSYDCEVYAMRVDGVHDQDICLASAAAVGFGAADQVALRNAFAYLKRAAEKMSAGRAQLDFPFDRIAGDRVPIKIVTYRNGKPSGSSTLESVGTAKLPASDFAAPAGYREQPIDLSQMAG